MTSSSDARPTIGERLLLALSRDPGTSDYSITTTEYTIENALDFAHKTVPEFDTLVRDRTVLDYGCGPGWQAVAMHERCGARRVDGLDINPTWLAQATALAAREGCGDAVKFGDRVPEGMAGGYDVVISLNAFEHFDDPALHLSRMRALVAPGGRVVISFAEPWYSHSGSHMNFFTKLPWVNVFFPEKTVLRVRSRFRSDGASRYEEVESGLNRMTIARFERIIRESGMRVERLKYHATAGLPLVDRVPVLREFLVSAATCVLTP